MPDKDLTRTMQLVVDAEPGQLVVHVAGELDAVTGTRLGRLLDGLVRRLAGRDDPDGRVLLVDLSGVRLFDTDGVAVLGGAARRCGESGVRLALAGVADRRGVLPLRVEQALDAVEAEIAGAGALSAG